jgi:hypothetical protein
MQASYFVLAAIHLVAIVVTGILWTIIDLVPGSNLRRLPAGHPRCAFRSSFRSWLGTLSVGSVAPRRHWPVAKPPERPRSLP